MLDGDKHGSRFWFIQCYETQGWPVDGKESNGSTKLGCYYCNDIATHMDVCLLCYPISLSVDYECSV